MKTMCVDTRNAKCLSPGAGCPFCQIIASGSMWATDERWGAVQVVCVCVCVCVRERERERERQRQRQRENSELYYTRIKILGSCLFLQFVPANLRLQRDRERETFRQTDRQSGRRTEGANWRYRRMTER